MKNTDEEKYSSKYGKSIYEYKRNTYNKKVVSEFKKYTHNLEKRRIPDNIEITYRDKLKPKYGSKIFLPVIEFIDALSLPISREVFLGKLDDLALSLDAEVFLREKSLFQEIEIHERKKKYHNVERNLAGIGDNEDITLLTDAHDLAQFKNPIEFVSADEEHICNKECTHLIIDKTDISEIIPLKDFLPY